MRGLLMVFRVSSFWLFAKPHFPLDPPRKQSAVVDPYAVFNNQIFVKMATAAPARTPQFRMQAIYRTNKYHGGGRGMPLPMFIQYLACIGGLEFGREQ
jgi:hypothetical protein